MVVIKAANPRKMLRTPKLASKLIKIKLRINPQIIIKKLSKNKHQIPLLKNLLENKVKTQSSNKVNNRLLNKKILKKVKTPYKGQTVKN